MTEEDKSLKKVLSIVNDKKDLNKDNIIAEIKTELKKQDRDLYKEWEKGKFDVNHVFILHDPRTLLMIAAANDCTKTVEVLLENGANVDAKDQYGWTSLHHAAYFCHEKIVEVLTEGKADVNAVDKWGKTPLDYAKDYDDKYCVIKSQNVVKTLLEAAFLKARNKAMIAGGVTALLGAAIAVALFTTGTITSQLIPIVITVVAVTAAALIVGCATYALLKPSTKVDGVEKPSVVLTTNEQQEAAV